MRIRAILAAGLAIAFVATGFTATGANAASFPSCTYSTITSVTSSRVAGAIRNCGSTPGAPWRKLRIMVDNASDGPCRQAYYDRTLNYSYDPTFWAPGLQHYATWAYC